MVKRNFGKLETLPFCCFQLSPSIKWSEKYCVYDIQNAITLLLNFSIRKLFFQMLSEIDENYWTKATVYRKSEDISITKR